MQHRTYTDHEFDDLFNPLERESDGEIVRDFADVKDEDARRVWTIVDGEGGGMYALPGFHVVNRVGYVLTEKPWTDENDVGVWMEPCSEENDDA